MMRFDPLAPPNCQDPNRTPPPLSGEQNFAPAKFWQFAPLGCTLRAVTRPDLGENNPAQEEQRGWFTTTHWSVVLAAREGGVSQGAAALEKLCRTYWPPLYAYI